MPVSHGSLALVLLLWGQDTTYSVHERAILPWAIGHSQRRAPVGICIWLCALHELGGTERVGGRPLLGRHGAADPYMRSVYDRGAVDSVWFGSVRYSLRDVQAQCRSGRSV